MRLATTGRNNPAGALEIEEMYGELCASLGRAPDLVVSYYTEELHTTVRAALAAPAVEAATIGVSSCQGAITDGGLFGLDTPGVAMLGISDADGSYGTGLVPLGDDAAGAAATALQTAIQQADRPGELPSLILLHTSPGAEEQVIDSLNDVTGGHCPIVGGSAADNAIAGRWSMFANSNADPEAVAVAVLYPSTASSTAFQSGYEPAGPAGTVTAADGRVLHEIDGRPAAVVYNEWTGGAIDDAFGDHTNNVLAATTMTPLGRQVGSLDLPGSSVPYFTLIHPERVTDEKGLTLFADVAVGQRLLLMSGTKTSLVRRAGDVVAAARADRIAEAAGGIVIYCAGCRLAVDGDLAQVQASLQAAYDGTPFLVGFTFGEQGCLLGGENRHGNLMISALALEARV